jgi:hypothetical protein
VGSGHWPVGTLLARSWTPLRPPDAVRFEPDDAWGASVVLGSLGSRAPCLHGAPACRALFQTGWSRTTREPELRGRETVLPLMFRGNSCGGTEYISVIVFQV